LAESQSRNQTSHCFSFGNLLLVTADEIAHVTPLQLGKTFQFDLHGENLLIKVGVSGKESTR
jgi:hypothetical protein